MAALPLRIWVTLNRFVAKPSKDVVYQSIDKMINRVSSFSEPGPMIVGRQFIEYNPNTVLKLSSSSRGSWCCGPSFGAGLAISGA